MGTPMICRASAALRSEQGSSTALCGELTAVLGDDEDAEGAAPPLFDVLGGWLHPQNSVNQKCRYDDLHSEQGSSAHPLSFWLETGL